METTGWWGGGRVLSYISHISMCRPKGKGFSPFWSGKGYRLCQFWSGVGLVFEGTTGVYERVRKKEKYAISKWILRRPFSCCSNQSNDDIISWFWNAVLILEARSEKGCEKWHFWSEIGSGFGEPGGTPPPRIPKSTPPGNQNIKTCSNDVFRAGNRKKTTQSGHLFMRYVHSNGCLCGL